MLSAAQEAIRNRQVAVAPCAGFHHACYAMASGYCTFNGLMITALALRTAAHAKRIGILDFDMHYGDGTDDIIKSLGVNFVKHYSAGQWYRRASQAQQFLESIPEVVATMRDCDVILYQAGADPHVDDPLGGWLTTEQLLARDLSVFKTAHALSIPVAWNLAGGYQSPLRNVLDIHDNTLRACSAIYLE
jgi:acetoin utilization deacetylase AcuC-like enzyme